MQDATTTNESLYLNPATTEFLKQFRDGLSSVRDLTGEFDHRKKKFKARGGYSDVYVTSWAPPLGGRPIQVSP